MTLDIMKTELQALVIEDEDFARKRDKAIMLIGEYEQHGEKGILITLQMIISEFYDNGIITEEKKNEYNDYLESLK